uniref:Uncharacterized protein n=1 Tax=Arundo donax TaxID=35708 RepID=A0A0A9AGU2_ARUDO
MIDHGHNMQSQDEIDDLNHLLFCLFICKTKSVEI